ncbi:MAG TPA: CoA transferase subunit A [Firmicutes bacterium]|nr:CoA transferase subunit A [Bacillota bacterium]
MKSKVRQLQDVVREIPGRGAEIAMGGFAISRCPVAFANELIRQGKKDLILYETIGGFTADLLVGAGTVRRYSYGGGSLDKFGQLRRVNEGIENGTLDVREYTALSLNLRFLAGSLGIPYIPSKALLGTDILAGLLVKDREAVMVQESPFDGEQYVCYRSLRPEYAVIHAPYADAGGNVVIYGPTWDAELARAAGKLIVTVEKVVSSEFIRQHPETVVISGLHTYAVCEVPYGAYPTSVYRAYDYDADVLSAYGRLNRKQAEFDQWLKEYVLGTGDHKEFLLKLAGKDKLASLQADPVFGYAKEAQ